MSVRLPPGLPKAIEVAARRRFVAPPAYVRDAILAALERDKVQVEREAA
jgi:hypothetical protein